MVARCLYVDTPPMVKRVACAVLWFLAVGWGLNFVVAITGVSPIIAMAVAAAVGAFVALDPLHLFWPAPAGSTVAPPLDTVPISGAMPTQV